MALSETYKAKLRAFEGSANYMYLDTVGVVTIGVGHALFAANDALNLPYPFRTYRLRADAPVVWSAISPGPLVLRDLDPLPSFYSPLPTPSLGIHVDFATRDQVRADWNTIHAKPMGHVYTWYRQFTNCWLSDSDVDALYEADLSTYWTTLATLFPKLTTYPQGAQDALFDLLYNSDLGKPGKWPNLKNSVAARDWAKAATQCQRGQIPADRNEFTKQSFLDAAADEARWNRRAADEIDFQDSRGGVHLRPMP